MDLNQEYTNRNKNYIQSIESTSGEIEWNVYGYDDYYDDDDSNNFGLNIIGSADSWDADLQAGLTIKMIDGYSYGWETSTEDGVVAVLNILKDGKKVGYYNVYYSFGVILGITGDGVVRYEKNNSYITIYSIDQIDYKSLTYTVSDPKFEVVVEDNEDDDIYVVIRWQESQEEFQRYYLKNHVGYISSVTGGYIMGFYEGSGYVDVYYDYGYDYDDLSWEDVTFTFENGYTGDIVLPEDEDGYVLQIKDSSGSVVATKTLYWEEW